MSTPMNRRGRLPRKVNTAAMGDELRTARQSNPNRDVVELPASAWSSNSETSRLGDDWMRRAAGYQPEPAGRPAGGQAGSKYAADGNPEGWDDMSPAEQQNWIVANMGRAGGATPVAEPPPAPSGPGVFYRPVEHRSPQ